MAKDIFYKELYRNDNGNFILLSASDGSKVSINGIIISIHDFVEMINVCRGKIIKKTNEESIGFLTHKMDQITAWLVDNKEQIAHMARVGVFETDEDEEMDEAYRQVNEIVKNLAFYFLSQR
jgi:hypothetical protein